MVQSWILKENHKFIKSLQIKVANLLKISNKILIMGKCVMIIDNADLRIAQEKAKARLKHR